VLWYVDIYFVLILIADWSPIALGVARVFHMTVMHLCDCVYVSTWVCGVGQKVRLVFACIFLIIILIF